MTFLSYYLPSLSSWTSFYILNDVPDAVIHSSNPWQLSFQDPASPTMAGIINLHHDVMFIVVLLSIFVCWLLVRTIYFFDMEETHATPAFRQIYNLPDKTVHGTALELGWTIVPTLILLVIFVDPAR